MNSSSEMLGSLRKPAVFIVARVFRSSGDILFVLEFCPDFLLLDVAEEEEENGGG